MKTKKSSKVKAIFRPDQTIGERISINGKSFILQFRTITESVILDASTGNVYSKGRVAYNPHDDFSLEAGQREAFAVALRARRLSKESKASAWDSFRSGRREKMQRQIVSYMKTSNELTKLRERALSVIKATNEAIART